jgi:cysteine-rich repeat protein
MKKRIIQTASLLTLLSLVITGTAHATMEQASYCGDGVLDQENGEQCDDGNFINRDSCSAYCLIEDMEGPKVTGIDIADGTENVSTLTKKVTLTFDEAVDPASIRTSTVQFKQFNKTLLYEQELSNNDSVLTLTFKEELQGDKDYSVSVQYVKDPLGNMNQELFVSTFYTGAYTDIIPPNIVVKPLGGLKHVGQSITLTPYIGEKTFSDDFIDEGARIYYTLDGSTPGTHSTLYEKSISIKTDTTLKYFGIDKKGNVSKIQTQQYTFDCAERPHAKSVTAYPECKIEECGYGYRLQNDVCVILLDELENDYSAAAATAPLFGSDTPMTISTKPALYVTPEHEGILPRPIHFVDLDGGGIIDFERDTKITDEDGTAFTGYLLPPKNLYSKSFPLNFGFSFKSIFNFEPAEGNTLHFEPMIKVTIPFTDRYEPGDPITIFTFDPITEEYFVHDPNLVKVNDAGDAVEIMTDSTETFFVAQPGQGYNEIVFKDTLDHWAKNYIEQLYRWDMVKGRSKGVFAPNDVLSRAEFTKIALNAIGEEVDPESADDAPFYDVPLYAWYAPYIKRAKELGLISGYPDGSFKPDEPINRVEALKMLLTAFQFDLTSIGQRTDTFEDVPTWEWYFPVVNFAYQHGLIDGIRLLNGKIQYDSFGPGRNIKRGEMAKLAIKAIELKDGEED